VLSYAVASIPTDDSVICPASRCTPLGIDPSGDALLGVDDRDEEGTVEDFGLVEGGELVECDGLVDDELVDDELVDDELVECDEECGELDVDGGRVEDGTLEDGVLEGMVLFNPTHTTLVSSVLSGKPA
jgi:hypothetical protein